MEKGFFLLEFITAITINGVLVLLIVLISVKASGTLKKVIIINIEVSGMKTNNVRAVKDSSYTTTLNAGIMEEYNEWSYMTRRGQAVLLANNAEKVLIIVEGEKDFIVVNVLGNLSSDTYAMSNEMLEDLADIFDFAAML